MIYNLDTKFDFGQFIDYTLKRVYVGCDNLNRMDYLVVNDELNRFFREKKPYSFKKGRIVINDQISLMRKIGIGLTSYDWLIYEKTSQKSYIEWCQKNIPSFCISLDIIEKLEELMCIFPKEFSWDNCHEVEFSDCRKGYNFEIKKLVCDYKYQKFSNEFKTINYERYNRQINL